MITVIAKLSIMAGKMEIALGEFKVLMSNVAKEEGTLLYSLNRDRSNPNILAVVEQYKDEDAFALHSSTPHFKEFFANSGSFLEGPPEVIIMEEISRT